MKHKAKEGHVLGPPCFGYRHQDVLTGQTDPAGRPIRSHVTRKVYEPEAAVVSATLRATTLCTPPEFGAV